MTLLQNYSHQLEELCLTNKVKSLFAFGSVTTNAFNSESDIDLIVDIADKDPLSYSVNYFNLKDQLERLFNRKVDLLEQKAIKNPEFKAIIDQTKVLIYGK